MGKLDSTFKTYLDVAKENVNHMRVVKEDSSELKLKDFKDDIHICEHMNNYFKYTNYHISFFNNKSSHDDFFENYQKTISSLSDMMERNTPMSELLKYLFSYYKEIYEKVIKAVNVSDIEGSTQSLLHLIKFWPLINRYPNTYIYIEPTTQLWSMVYKTPKKGTLSFVVSDNGEIRFSFIKQGEGLSKFTGRARISKKIQDYKHIRLLFEMMSLD